MPFCTFGWELIHKSVERDVKNEDDILLTFIHWLLVKNEFLCIGRGENVDVTDNELKSETLPNGWNDGETYALRYLDPKQKLFILRGLKNDVNIILNLVRTEDLNVTSVSFNPKEEVKSLKGGLDMILPHFQDLGVRVLTTMIEPQQGDPIKSKESSTQTRIEQEGSNVLPPGQPRRDPLMIGEPRRPDPLGSLADYGRSDLDPLSSMRNPVGGGMLFDPFSGNRGPRINPNIGIPGPGLPRGAVPSGARFDPFGPPDADRDFGLRGPRLPGSGPNPDMLPPGYDDMFM